MPIMLTLSGDYQRQQRLVDTYSIRVQETTSAKKRKELIYDSRIEKQLIESSGIYLPDSLNLFGMVENPTSTVNLSNPSANIYTSGSDQNTKDDVIYRTTIQAKVTNPTPAKLPAKGDKYSVASPTLSTAVLIKSLTISSPLLEILAMCLTSSRVSIFPGDKNARYPGRFHLVIDRYRDRLKICGWQTKPRRARNLPDNARF